MDIEFDSAKDEANIAKHGVSLARGADVEGRLFVCTYTMRGETFRIISVRKAHRKEQAKWQS